VLAVPGRLGHDVLKARPRRLSRAAAVVGASVTALSLVLAVSAFAPGLFARGNAQIALYLDGVAVDASGSLVALPAGVPAKYLPGSRVVDPTATERAEADREWLAAGRVPGIEGPYADVVAGALLDLRTLTAPNGALIAAHSPRWRYVWPRDASFGAAALAVAGHPQDAARILAHLQRLHAASGSFEARYVPDGSGAVPDDRHAQSDGAGWVLWATSVYLDRLPAADRAQAAARLVGLVDAAREHIRDQTATRSGLPLPSGDYWETSHDVLTLGTAAPLLAGLEAAGRIYPELGRHVEARSALMDADRLKTAVTSAFGSRGYPRTLRDRQQDAATAFLLPPFQPAPLEGAVAAWRRSIAPMARPAGGLAPGGGWRQDGISWTPQTALYALAAASTGDVRRAEHWLTWLAAHRTGSGALPEKVLADGSPAAVAPLAWTCALVVLAVDTLERTSPHPPAPATLLGGED
jgi:hypothetical protein